MLESLMLLDQLVYERLGWSASAPGVCIIKLIMAVIYGFCNKLEFVPKNYTMLERLAKEKHSSLLRKL